MFESFDNARLLGSMFQGFDQRLGGLSTRLSQVILKIVMMRFSVVQKSEFVKLRFLLQQADIDVGSLLDGIG